MCNTNSDGSCFFEALFHQMQYHKFCDEKQLMMTMRSEIIQFIKSEDELYEHITSRLVDMNIETYLMSMLNPKTWADENIMYAAALLYNVKITILRPKGVSTAIGSSDRDVHLGYVSLGSEEHPNHYVSLVKTCAGMLKLCYF